MYFCVRCHPGWLVGWVLNLILFLSVCAVTLVGWLGVKPDFVPFCVRCHPGWLVGWVLNLISFLSVCAVTLVGWLAGC